MSAKRILVIKLGALGDVVLAFAAMKRIREAHPDADITVLTTPPFADLIAASPYADRVRDDGRPDGLWPTLRMLLRLRRTRWSRVYDLQTSSRSSAYIHAFWPRKVQWSGVAPGAALPHRNPRRDHMHTLERQADQLKDAGVWPDAPVEPGTAPPPDLSWMVDPDRASALGAQAPFALLVPGGSPHRLDKRWPGGRYGRLALELARMEVQPVLIGGAGEKRLAQEILDVAPQALDLTGRTGFRDIASLGAKAALAVGNDTGPLHLIAAAGAPTLALFSEASDPALTAPRGPRVEVLRRPSLDDLSVEEVQQAAEQLL